MLNGSELIHTPVACTNIAAGLTEALNEYTANDKECLRYHSLTPRHCTSSILAPIYLKIVVDVAAYFKISR